MGSALMGPVVIGLSSSQHRTFMRSMRNDEARVSCQLIATAPKGVLKITVKPSRRNQPIEHRIQTGKVELTCYEWHPELRDTGAPFLFAHATGFHGRVWDQTLHHLGPRWAFCLDQRGHGKSETALISNWEVFGEDLSKVVESLNLRSVIGVGHSMGGHAMVEAAVLQSHRFKRLLLIDPVIGPPDLYVDPPPLPSSIADEGHPAGRRRDLFESPEAMYARFRKKAPFCHFVPEALRDYCDYGLNASTDPPGFRLACPPQVEASIYMSARSNRKIFKSIEQVSVPVTVLRAKQPDPDRNMMDFSSSPTWPALALTFADGLDIHLPEASHFIPMESPALTARWVAQRDARQPEKS